MTKKQYLNRSVVITDEAYRSLQKASQLTGLPLGTLTTIAVTRMFDPKNNEQVATVLESTKRDLIEAILS